MEEENTTKEKTTLISLNHQKISIFHCSIPSLKIPATLSSCKVASTKFIVSVRTVIMSPMDEKTRLMPNPGEQQIQPLVT